MKFLMFSLFLFLCLPVWSSQYALEKSHINYTVKYTFKTVHAKTEKARGKGVCEKGSCQFLVAVPVKEFNSGDSSRDVRTLEVTKAALHPLVKFNVTVPEGNLKSDFKSDVEVELAGVKQTLKDIPFTVKKDGNQFSVSSKFAIQLTKFKIERPKLLTIPIDDEVPIDFTSTWSVK
ncbi:MAG: YceI family protein [Bdellovibrionales bacterium]|nr:YceI family protein [Bdellovibrionales bacterium]